MSPTSYQTAPPRGGPTTIVALVTPLQVRGARPVRGNPRPKGCPASVSGHSGALAERLCAPCIRADVDDEPEDHDEPAEAGHAGDRRVRDRPPERRPREEEEA